MNLHRLISYFDILGKSHNGPAPTLAIGGQGAYGHYGDLLLTSRYQPLLDRNMQIVAHEALLRAQEPTGRYIAPDQLFAKLGETHEVVVLDRMCRAMHAVNYVTQPNEGRLLFLNVDGRHLQGIRSGKHGETFEALLEYCDLKPSQVVLEIIESSIGDLGCLQKAIHAYKAKGFRIAIDDFGCRHSNFDRVWALEPDIVKMDRSLLLQAQQNARAAKVLPVLVRLIQDLGAKVVCEGIETEEQHQRAMASGTDMVQGYYYARPSIQLKSTATASSSVWLPGKAEIQVPP